ncbi:hypothetical protein TNCV_4100561 [Trichonephila clavipes]|nr:hypothetical protein TNCV_4100561 [Trichonephila clavipes]
MASTLPPLLDSLVGGGKPERHCFCFYGFNAAVPSFAEVFFACKSFLDSPLTISSHKSLNTSCCVISEPDLLNTPEAESLDGFSDQGVIQLRVAKCLTASTAAQTDETIANIICPPLKLLQPLISIPKPTMSSEIPAVTISSTSTRAHLLPPTSCFPATLSKS